MEEILGFSKTEYLVTFHSIIFGYVASEFMEGWGSAFRNRKSVQLDHHLLSFSLIVFLLMLIHWTNLYSRANSVSKNFIEFVTLLPYTFLFYFISILTHQRKLSVSNAHSSKYFKHHKLLYGLLLGFLVYDLIATVNSEIVIYRVIGIALCLVGIFTDSKGIHRTLLLACSISLISYILHDFVASLSREISSGYSKIEHLTVFTSMIYGYIITLFFVGWSRLIKSGFHGFSWTQVFWTFFAFLILIDMWWGFWNRNVYIGLSILHFIASLLTPIFIFLIAILLFPKDEDVDYHIYFFDNKNLIYSLFAGMLAIQIGLSYFYQEPQTQENYFRLAGITVALLSLKIQLPIYHRLLVLIGLALLCINIWIHA